MASMVSKRQDYHDLAGIDYEASFPLRTGLDRSQTELLNCIRDGTFYHGVVKSKFDPNQTAACSCGLGLDNTRHRALVCPHFQSVRAGFQDVVGMWDALPTCMTEHGLCPENPLQIEYWQHLSELPMDTPCWTARPGTDGSQHLCADGSCDGNHASAALASWCVTSADLGVPIATGLLPGCLQTIDRSELWGCHHGLSVAHPALRDRNCIYYTDSQYVVDGWTLLTVTPVIPSDWSNGDLWEELLHSQQVAGPQVCVMKIRAHLTPDASSDIQDPERTRWNAVADLNAKIARQVGGTLTFRNLRKRLLSTSSWRKFWTHRVQMYLLALAEFSVKSCTVAANASFMGDAEEELVSLLSDASCNHHDWQDSFPILTDTTLNSFEDFISFGISHVMTLCHWLLKLDRTAGYVKNVTLMEFFVGYHLDVGGALPVASRTSNGTLTWLATSSDVLSVLVPRTLKSQMDVCSWIFATLMKNFQISVDRGHLSKPHLGIIKPLPSFMIPWPIDLETKVQLTLSAYTARRPVRYARDLARAFP